MSTSFVTLWTVNHQAPLSVGFPRREHWSGLPFPCPENRPNPEIEPASTALQAGSSLLSHQGSPLKTLFYQYSDKTILKIFFSRMVVLNNSRLNKSSFLRTITLKSSLSCTFWGIRIPGFHSRTLCMVVDQEKFLDWPNLEPGRLGWGRAWLIASSIYFSLCWELT